MRACSLVVLATVAAVSFDVEAAQWSYTFDGLSPDGLHSVRPSGDGGYLVTGEARGAGGAQAAWLDAFDHYFVTASKAEIAALDGGRFPGWTRTGESFQVYGLDPAAASVCRFWSGQTFAPKSSHFHTPLDWECAKVKENPDWSFEGEVFGMQLPTITGACRIGTIPLNRLYYDGTGDAPNHRYTTSPDTRSEMAAKGWISEGYGALGVIGCVPAP